MCTDHYSVFSCGHKELFSHEACRDYSSGRVTACEVRDRDHRTDGLCDRCTASRRGGGDDRGTRTRSTRTTRQPSRNQDTSSSYHDSRPVTRTRDDDDDDEYDRYYTSSRPHTETHYRFDDDGGRSAYRRQTQTHRDPYGSGHGYTERTEYTYNSGDSEDARLYELIEHNLRHAEARQGGGGGSGRPRTTRTERSSRYRQPAYSSNYDDSDSDDDDLDYYGSYGRSSRYRR